MKLFQWEPGRQQSGYKKFTLIYSVFLKLDCYLIHYPEESYIPPHVDSAPNGKMYRLNIELRRAEQGGIFQCTENIFSLFGRIFLFRPDIEMHSVSKIQKGSRLIFSIGKIV